MNAASIILRVAREYSIAPEAITGTSRKALLVEARQMACCIMYDQLQLNHETIAKEMNLHRTTVSYHITRFRDILPIYKATQTRYHAVKAAIEILKNRKYKKSNKMKTKLTKSQLEGLHLLITIGLQCETDNKLMLLLQELVDKLNERLRKKLKNNPRKAEHSLTLNSIEEKALYAWYFKMRKVLDHMTYETAVADKIFNQIDKHYA